VASIVALLPAVAQFVNIDYIPTNMRWIVLSLTSIVGIASILSIMLYSDLIKKCQKSTVGNIMMMSVLFGILCMIAQLNITKNYVYEFQVGRDQKHMELIAIPFNPDDKLNGIMKNWGFNYRDASEESTEDETIIRLVKEQNYFTEIFLVIAILFSQIFITAGIFLGVWRLATIFGVKSNY
jgi:hypothetical protein